MELTFRRQTSLLLTRDNRPLTRPSGQDTARKPSRKRAEVREERARDRQKERDAWMRRREGRAGRTQSQSQASRDTSSDTSNSSRCGSPGSPSAPSGRAWRANKLQLRKDFLNKHNCKAVSISGGRTLPAHLRKGGIRTDSASSPVSIASTASSSSRTSTAEDAQSTTCSSYDSSSYKSESDSSSPRSPHAPSPWSKTVAWQSHAKVPADDASSVASGETRDAFRNPWKRMPPIQSARPRWGDIVDHFPQSGFGPLPRVESRREDDETSDASEFDTEPF
ncbi:hypothetical protein L226DRAFT_162643 [Lentinus tigrinus ALCF2SS1-7]|uniref:uncharacterized protein n=1 Tax=Lentinus tigrinus ALCF2SS1-7 TaxID=1328758 RepID=UPI00116615EF|nr:hypothetical protein L226DRAFT_162643 [Lentinus tigrinus ALCF2SS1-7]